jgi:hypothetical protein
MVGEGPDGVIYIYRNGSGQFRVFPSPVVVATGSTVVFKSLSRVGATVNLPFDPSAEAWPHSESETVWPVEVPSDGTASRPVTIPRGGQGYHEYEVLADERYLAEGTSPPGFIVDP